MNSQILKKIGDYENCADKFSKKTQKITKNVLTSLSKNRKIQKTFSQNFQKLENFKKRANNLKKLKTTRNLLVFLLKSKPYEIFSVELSIKLKISKNVRTNFPKN